MLELGICRTLLGRTFADGQFSDREAAVIIFRPTYGEWHGAVLAVDGLDRNATIYSSAMSSLRGRTVPAPSGWTKGLREPIGGHCSCGFFRVQRDS